MLVPRRLLPLVAAVVAAMMSSTTITMAQTEGSSSSTTDEGVVRTPTGELNGWYPCTQFTFEEQIPKPDPFSFTDEDPNPSRAECATFKAPLCYEGVCEGGKNQTVEIFVKRIPATSNAENKPNVWFMQGGPGAGSTAMETALTGIHDLLMGDVNVYTMDHRGTGRSTKLDCVAAQALTSGSPQGTSISPVEVASCAAELESRYGSDLRAFSITTAASDMKNFISTYQKDMDTFVFGVSYGTALVERLMHLDPPGVKGFILDGVATTGGSKKGKMYFSNWDTQQDEVAQLLFSMCDGNEMACGKYFKSSSLGGVIRKLLTDLESPSFKCTNPVRGIISELFGPLPGEKDVGSALRQVFGIHIQDSILRQFIPVLAHRMSRCNDDDIQVVLHYFRFIGPLILSKSEESMFSSDLTYRIIAYSEMWEVPTPSEEELMTKFWKTSISGNIASLLPGYCTFTKDKSAACAPYAEFTKYDASPIQYKRDKYWGVTPKVSKDQSVLVMSSKLDPQTPHKIAEWLFEDIEAQNKKLITFEYATHATLWSTQMSELGSKEPPCGMQIVASYIRAGGNVNLVDTSCQISLEPISWMFPQLAAAQLLNSTDAFDGEFTGTRLPVPDGTSAAGASANSEDSSSNKYKTMFFVFVGLVVVVLGAGGFFFYKWRAAKRQQQAKSIEVYEAADV